MFKQLLASEFAPYGKLSEVQLAQLERHYEALTRWNERLNLTRIRNLAESIQFHYCESLFLGAFLPPGSANVVDIGSGGGFPGIPVAILRPEYAVTLVESHQRKAVFLREAGRELPNIQVVSKRAQDIEGGFDWLISRAVAPEEVVRLRLASNVALLIGEDDATKLVGVPTPLPWGNRRVLFHVKPPNRSSP